ncbi:unnamed protein product [Arabis nemorensis]|uniref:Uncharacterized protein n=1 Tax=Arabis nemorensis TaxID=586526 RepID=A0A565B6U5_9BRAS|nr:unnamed protein product [Arabis nemorensis]
MRSSVGLLLERGSSSQIGALNAPAPSAPHATQAPHAAQGPPAAQAPPAGEEIALQQCYSRVLHPSRQNGAKWFDHDTPISTCVRKVIEGSFKGPWYSWSKVPLFYKEAWYSTFKTRYEWDPAIEHLVKTNFDKLAASRLRGMVSLAKSRGRTPEAIQKSGKARASRMSDRYGLGVYRHRAGSRSYLKVQDGLVANNEDASYIAVMKKTHQKPDSTYVDERARIIAEKYEELVQEYLSQLESSNSNGELLTIDALTLEEKNEIYVKIAGISKQGRVFGIGSIQSGAMSLGTSPDSSQAVEDAGTLTRRVEELESELKTSLDENVLFRKRFETMEQLVQSLSGQNINSSSGTSASTPP